MQQTIDNLTGQLNVVNAALQGLLRGGGNKIGGIVNLAHVAQKLKIPEPKPYSGAQNAKEVENVIFDIEQYFDVVGGLEEAKKVAIAIMYLQDNAKLWWRVKYEAIKAGEDALETWAELKVAICLQFFPENVEYNARRNLRELCQNKSVRDYVREFSTLMLNIRDIGDKDKLFTFLEGLKPYARMEFQRQRVDTLPKAIQEAECLGDYQVKARKDRSQQPVRGGFKGGQPNTGGPSRSGGDRSATKSKAPSSGSTSAASSNNDRGRKPPSGCRHCGGPHWNNKCPHAQMNAHQAFKDGTDDNADDADQTGPVCAFNAIVGSISEPLAGTSAGIHKKKDPCPIAKKGTPPHQERTLMFVDMKVNVPLTELLKKVTPWDWGPKRAEAFDALKMAMSSSPVLALPDLAKPFEVQTDASDYALGGVLLQEGHHVAYESRKLKDAERRYAAHEKELLGCDAEENTWERGTKLKDYKSLIDDYLARKALRTSPTQVGENVMGGFPAMPHDPLDAPRGVLGFPGANGV
ncbi:uncharacterized protein [Nicotiana tomentosiformis]|uniref:uncharacterized protein n=1 Tax=Nicotiana tomentosiformis TaxID=4098 RepID=UPI00388C5821